MSDFEFLHYLAWREPSHGVDDCNDANIRTRKTYEHPLVVWRSAMRRLGIVDLAVCEGFTAGASFYCAALITNREALLEKKTKTSCILNLEDLTGRIRCHCPYEIFFQQKDLLTSGEPLLISCLIESYQRKKGEEKIVTSRFECIGVSKLEEASVSSNVPVYIVIDSDKKFNEQIFRLKNIILENKGNSFLRVYVRLENAWALLQLGDEYKVRAGCKLYKSIAEWTDPASLAVLGI